MHRGKLPGEFIEQLCYLESELDPLQQLILLARHLYMNGKKNKFVVGGVTVLLAGALVVAVTRDWAATLIALAVGMILAAVFIWR